MVAPNQMDCSAAACDFKTPANIPTYELVLKSLELHIATAHSSGVIQNMKVTKCVEWLTSQTYEAFERDLKVWRNCTKIDPTQQNMLFIEMLKKTDNDKVKEFYENI